MTELEPCPFCGSTDNLFVEPDERGSGGQWVSPIHVGCCQWKGCGVSLTGGDTAEAVAKWNTRALARIETGTAETPKSDSVRSMRAGSSSKNHQDTPQ